MTDNRRLRLEWASHQGSDCLQITGWSEAELSEMTRSNAGALSRRLALYPSDALGASRGCATLPPIAGGFEVHDERVLFRPRFTFVDSIEYALLIDQPGSVESETWTIRRQPNASLPTARVLEIYPTAEVVPLNLLRIYVQFSDPMSDGWAERAIRIRSLDTGQPLENVFLPPAPELWDSERRRLTMLLDPGRIKRGLVPNLESGYPLADGMTVEISVDLGFRDARGQPLKTTAQRTYRVGPALRSRIDPGRWSITVPPSGSSAPLLVEFDRPLDHGLLRHSLSVQDSTGNTLHGTTEIVTSELAWSFTPARPWECSQYQLVIEPRLEDMAGNTPARVFDRDISRPEDAPQANTQTRIPFNCGPVTR